MAERIEINEELDRLYNKTIRCPYCKTKILKYTATCPKCGISKKQIAEASNLRAKEIQKEKTGEKLFKTRNRPADVSFTKMALLLLLGIFGAHNFYVGRKVKGFIMLGMTLVAILCFIIFPVSTVVGESHAVRLYFENQGMPFPADFLIAASFIIWALDAVAIIFGFYKYPIRLGEQKENGKTKAVKPESKEPKGQVTK